MEHLHITLSYAAKLVGTDCCTRMYYVSNFVCINDLLYVLFGKIVQMSTLLFFLLWRLYAHFLLRAMLMERGE